jgi:hypothetical protein
MKKVIYTFGIGQKLQRHSGMMAEQSHGKNARKTIGDLHTVKWFTGTLAGDNFSWQPEVEMRHESSRSFQLVLSWLYFDWDWWTVQSTRAKAGERERERERARARLLVLHVYLHILSKNMLRYD